MNTNILHKSRLFLSAALLTSITMPALGQTSAYSETIKQEVDKQAELLMKEYNIPGMTFGLTLDGKAYFYNYGLANQQLKQFVTENTMFELGSVSKTFAATLASYAEHQGSLSFDDKAEQYMPALKGSVIGETKLIQLATYTAGGLPLQFPDDVTNNAEMLQYYQSWQPRFAANTKRQYSNPSIGLFGYIAALSMKGDYAELIEKVLLPQLNMANTFVNVPEDKMRNYALGYNASGDPVRVTPGVLDAQAYGIKSTSADMVRYLEANIGIVPLDKDMQQVLNNTKTGYYQSSTFTQGLAWEMYPYPVNLKALSEGNSPDTILKPMPITVNKNPEPVLGSVWVNKTGSTGGFGAYVAYIPAKKAGIVILANKNYPNVERVKAAYAILDVALKH